MTDAEIKVLTQLRDRLAEERDNAADTVRDWTKKVNDKLNTEVATYPWSASDKAFECAAINSVFTQAILAIDKRINTPEESNLTIDSLTLYAFEEVLKRGASPMQSTSLSKNYIYACEGAAWDQVRRHLQLAKALL